MAGLSSYKEALLVGGIRIGANILMIGALFLAMYFASASYGNGMLTFCAWFFGITVPVWCLAVYLTKYVRRLARGTKVSYILLPGADAPCLVSWRVIREATEGTKQ